MDKQEVSQRVLQNGKPLPLDKFEWDEKTKTFSTNEIGLVIEFINISDCTFKTGGCCTFKTGGCCTFDTGSDCTFKTGGYCTFKTGGYCTFDTGGYCTFTTDWDCTFKTGSGCTFKTGSYCTFTTDWDCTFTTGGYCTFTTGSDCTFKTGWGCTFTTGSGCVVVRSDLFEVIMLKEGIKTQINPYNIPGYLAEVDGKMYPSGDVTQGEHIIIDGILSKVISRKGNVLKVINHGEDEQTYIVADGGKYAHGQTLKKARESLIYKLSNRDTSKFKDWELDREITFAEAVESYRAITGACEAGTRGFVERTKLPKNLTVAKVIEITKGQYGNETYKQFFNKE